MERMLLTVAAATFALTLQPAAACESTAKIYQPAHLTTAALGVLAAAAGPDYEIDLPSLESLTADSDFSVFMQPGVAKDVQTAALRKLWRVNPAFSRTDGLDSDAEDWRP